MQEDLCVVNINPEINTERLSEWLTSQRSVCEMLTALSDRQKLAVKIADELFGKRLEEEKKRRALEADEARKAFLKDRDESELFYSDKTYVKLMSYVGGKTPEVLFENITC